MDISRRGFLGCSAAAMAGMGALPLHAGAQTARETLPERPNLVFIILDTLRADMLGCYGYPGEVSPEFDELAAKGVLFERVISQCPWTRPSCGSALTSLYPRTLGLYKERGEMMPDGIDTLPIILQRNGYATFGATANPNLNVVFNFHNGFDKYVDSSVVFSWMPRTADTKLRGRGQGLANANDLFSGALEWAKTKGDRPGYIQLNAMEIHEWYSSRSMLRPEFRMMFRKTGGKFHPYLQSVRQLTVDTTQFVKDLTALPGWENTFFVFISDHGEGLDENKGLPHAVYHGWMLYESAVIVPWIIYHPTWQPPAPCVSQTVRLLEFLPTTLDLLGLPVPDGLDGKSMAPVILGERKAVDLPEYFVTETQWRDANKLAAYAANWKYFDNKAVTAGAPKRELQPRGYRERGVLTDQLVRHPEIADPMRDFLVDWEKKHPARQPTFQKTEMSEEEIEQLKAVGYLQ